MQPLPAQGPYCSIERTSSGKLRLLEAAAHVEPYGLPFVNRQLSGPSDPSAFGRR